MKKAVYKFRTNDTHFIMPAIKGHQGGKTFYTVNIPMYELVKMVKPVENTNVEDRSQRELNPRRATAIAEYVKSNKETYVLPALTISLIKSGKRVVKWEPIDEGEMFGEIYIPRNFNILLNDGQHRHAAITELMADYKNGISDTIALTVYQDVEKHQADQMFVDINLNAVKPAGSINTLFNHRDPWATLAVAVSKKAKILTGRTEYEKANCTGKSDKVFSLKAIESFCKSMLPYQPDSENMEENVTYISKVFDGLYDSISDWNDFSYMPDGSHLVKPDTIDISTDELKEKLVPLAQWKREYSMSTTAVALEAMAVYVRSHCGAAAMSREYKDQDTAIKNACADLAEFNWQRDDSHWAGRVVNRGRILKNKTSITLASNMLLKHAGVPLNFDQQYEENRFTG